MIIILSFAKDNEQAKIFMIDLLALAWIKITPSL
jgi:hypothetical protein